MKKTEGRNAFAGELEEFADAYELDSDLLRFHRNHDPENLMERIMNLDIVPEAFQAVDGFEPVKASFITQDEIDHMLTRGSGFSEGKLRIYAYFMQGHDAKERTDFLKSEYGDGGYSYTGYDQWHDSKGIKFTRADEISGSSGYDTVTLNWSRVEKRIHELIDAGRFLNQKELDYIPAYEKKVLARQIYSFYYNQPQDVVRPFPEVLDFNAVDKVIAPLLDSPEQVDMIFNRMMETFTRTQPDARDYDSMKEALRDMAAYQRGEYSLFTPLPEETLQADREKKQAAKDAKRQNRKPQGQRSPRPMMNWRLRPAP